METRETEPIESEMPTSIEEVAKKFTDPVEVTSTEGITSFFKDNHDQNRLCIAIPVTIENEEARQQEFAKIALTLRTAIFKYTGVEKDSAIGPSLLGLIGEATSDIAKHTVLRDRFSRILVLVTKNDLDVSFHLVNPARPDADLYKINQEDNPDDYEVQAHGDNLSAGLKEYLLCDGCPSVKDESHLVKDNASGEIIAFERDISIELPN